MVTCGTTELNAKQGGGLPCSGLGIYEDEPMFS